VRTALRISAGLTLFCMYANIKMHNEELNDLYCSPNIGRMIKLRMRWAEHVARMGGEERRIQGFGGEN
jgi:hypothetical protein